jgi:hypothetical protein
MIRFLVVVCGVRGRNFSGLSVANEDNREESVMKVTPRLGLTVTEIGPNSFQTVDGKSHSAWCAGGFQLGAHCIVRICVKYSERALRRVMRRLSVQIDH